MQIESICRRIPTGWRQISGLKALMLLAVILQRQPSLGFNPVFDQLLQLLDGAVHGHLGWKGHELAMPPEKGLKEDCLPRQPASSKTCQ